MDETSISIKYLNGQIYADIVSHAVQVKTTQIGCDKQQTTLILTIFADGSTKVKPLILFKGEDNLVQLHHL